MNERLNAVLNEYAREKVAEKGSRQYLDAAALIATNGKIKQTKQNIAAELMAANADDDAKISAVIQQEDAAYNAALEQAKNAREVRKQAIIARAPAEVANIKTRAQFASIEKLNAVYSALGLPTKQMTARVNMPITSMAQAVEVKQ
jgi:hypothetical protein